MRKNIDVFVCLSVTHSGVTRGCLALYQRVGCQGEKCHTEGSMCVGVMQGRTTVSCVCVGLWCVSRLESDILWQLCGFYLFLQTVTGYVLYV